jgi:hypothetical protein
VQAVQVRLHGNLSSARAIWVRLRGSSGSARANHVRLRGECAGTSGALMRQFSSGSV